MGLFYKHRQQGEYHVLTIRPASYLFILLVVAANIILSLAQRDQAASYAGMLVFALAVWYTVEAWPVIKANWTDKTYEKKGKHLLSFQEPLEFWIKQ